ncbi:MAG: alpha/beta fold hydrolase [Acidobacteria bacterium]|nr:alpha/beta fold hydrolase [Acidobacteriota bacterium]
MNSALWHRVGLRLSAHGYRVYAPEMLGLGYTDGPDDYDHSLRGQAGLFRLFASAVVQDEYVLVGHDLGGGVAQIVVSETPQSVEKCVLTDCVAFDSWPVDAIKPLIAAAHRETYREIFTPEHTRNFLQKALSFGLLDASAITEELIEDLLQGLTGTADHLAHFVRFLRAMDNKQTQDASSKLTGFQGETLLVWAKADQFQPVSVGERLRSVLPHAAWTPIEGRHFHPLESSALADAIIQWDKGARNGQ